MNTTHALVTKAEMAREVLADTVSALADERMEEVRAWFKATFPGMKLKIVFGMGAEAITLGDDSRRVSFARQDGFARHYAIEVEPPTAANAADAAVRYTRPYFCLQPLAEALCDVNEITNNYHDGCPNDFEVLP